MSSDIINYYRYFCNTENTNVYNWDNTTPTVCPNDNTHHVNLDSLTIINTIHSNSVTIKQTSGDIHGNYRIESKVLSIPANQTSSTIISWPFDVAIMTVNWTSSNIHRGDIINGYVAENTIIGAIIQPINLGDTKIHVSPTVLQYINKGYIVTITDGHQIINMEQCISIDESNNTISCENPSSMSLNAGSYVRMTINNIRNIHIGEPESVRLATKHLGSSSIPTGTKLNFQYQNNGNVAKTFVFSYEYLY